MRQVYGAGVAQLEIMAFANVTGRAQADGRHASGNGRPDPAGAVFDHKTFIRLHGLLACGEQKNIRVRLSSRDHIGTKDTAFAFAIAWVTVICAHTFCVRRSAAASALLGQHALFDGAQIIRAEFDVRKLNSLYNEYLRHPLALAAKGSERIYEGLSLAGVPEGK